MPLLLTQESGARRVALSLKRLMSTDANSADPSDLSQTISEAGPVCGFAARPGPSAIGAYRVLRLLGEGGMGAVHEAEQDSPRRAAALKVIKAACLGKYTDQSISKAP